MMTTLFIADLHLRESRPDVAERFLQFTKTKAREAKALYILGDFFEVWIGDDDLNPFHLKIIHALKALTDSGVDVYFMRGNRDFLIGKRFAKLTGCHLLHDPSVITIEKKRLLLTHGDLLNTSDKKYLRFRRRTRKWIIQKLFLLLYSLDKRKKIAQNIREKSKAHIAAKKDSDYGIMLNEARAIMKKYHADYLIHGHFHKPEIYHIAPNKTGISIGDWESDNEMQVLVFQQDNHYSLYNV